ncbi:pyrroloquinoline quinone biosynthesis protein PqqB [Virgifigura deserti]|uniref:pyrroloquinoline quinone biosynthesis protein PqqB n=1 Tax=Virgifigura deserti TaxID=2268457 RepID=UPI003CCBA08C
MVLRLLIVGSAAGGGFPQWNSNDEGSRRARSGDPNALPRSQSSIAVSADGRRWTLFNASPDLRQQINANPQLHPQDGKRHSPLTSVVLTNGDVDHVAGLLTLRESHPLALYATDRVLQVLRENSIFNVLNPNFVERRKLPLDTEFEVSTRDGDGTGLFVEAFAVPGKVALYREDVAAGPDFGTQPEDTIGLKISSGGSSLFYIPGCARMSEDLGERLRGAALVLFDGTLWRDDEMIVAGVGSKTGKRMGHISVSGPDGSIAAFEPLGVKRKVFVHMNNSNPILLADSAERAIAEKAGWEIAFDGMELTL